MHTQLLELVIERCRERQREGDKPTKPPYSVEQLEDAVTQLATTTERQACSQSVSIDWLEVLRETVVSVEECRKDSEDDPTAELPNALAAIKASLEELCRQMESTSNGLFSCGDRKDNL